MDLLQSLGRHGSVLLLNCVSTGVDQSINHFKVA